MSPSPIFFFSTQADALEARIEESGNSAETQKRHAERMREWRHIRKTWKGCLESIEIICILSSLATVLLPCLFPVLRGVMYVGGKQFSGSWEKMRVFVSSFLLYMGY